ncbi:hypothetical protein [Streptomyces sp. NPDC055060]
MRRTPDSTGPFTRFARGPRLTLVTTAAAVLALGACGAEKADADKEHHKSAVTVGDKSDAADAAFTKMLARVAQSCPPSAPPKAPPSEPAKTPPGAVEADVEPVTPTSGPEVELNARDWCASARHEERIAQALWNLKDPTPAKVRTILNDLGYIDDRIHDLKRTGATVRFFLDLRDKGGRLCEQGSAAGERTVVDACVAPVNGPFRPAESKG